MPLFEKELVMTNNAVDLQPACQLNVSKNDNLEIVAPDLNDFLGMLMPLSNFQEFDPNMVLQIKEPTKSDK